jgi:hypothetical protein
MADALNGPPSLRLVQTNTKGEKQPPKKSKVKEEEDYTITQRLTTTSIHF